MTAPIRIPLADALAARLGFPVFDDETRCAGLRLAAAARGTGRPVLTLVLVGDEMLTSLRRRAARIAATLMFGEGIPIAGIAPGSLTLERAVAGPAGRRNRIEMTFGRCPGA